MGAEPPPPDSQWMRGMQRVQRGSSRAPRARERETGQEEGALGAKQQPNPSKETEERRSHKEGQKPAQRQSETDAKSPYS